MTMQSAALARLEEETHVHHALADHDRLSLLASPPTIDAYRRLLASIYGFESPVEAAVQMTPGLDEVLDLRGRTGWKLLRSDLVALGVPDPGALERCPSVFPFRGAAEALGWLYVLERNARPHGLLRRGLEQRLGEPFARACAYLTGSERAAGVRMRELGDALDAVARAPEVAERVVDAARAAFRCQRAWFARDVMPRARVA